ncbi:transposon Tf2-6 polyprotein [Trichonephila clavipes]|nr:transposon Tf2-6 polyprotein [Trichonephila clavipes]
MGRTNPAGKTVADEVRSLMKELPCKLQYDWSRPINAEKLEISFEFQEESEGSIYFLRRKLSYKDDSRQTMFTSIDRVSAEIQERFQQLQSLVQKCCQYGCNNIHVLPSRLATLNEKLTSLERRIDYLEARYREAITDTFTKFNYIVSNLPPEAAAIVRDLIITPDETDPYGTIKAQLIQRTGRVAQQEIRKLLTSEELGDRKPSELLRTMNRRAASHNVPGGAYVGTFSSAATDPSANYLGIHHANNRRESRRSRRQNP